MTSRFLYCYHVLHTMGNLESIKSISQRLRFQLSDVEICSTFDLKLVKFAWTISFLEWKGFSEQR